MDSTESQLNMHATAISISGAGVMVCGPSGSGKSDLALRLIDRGAQLISDDYVTVESHGDRLLLSPPAAIAGKLEVRALGVLETEYVSGMELKLVIKLGSPPERYPMDRQTMILLGKTVPYCTLDAMEPSAPIKAERALQRIIESASET